MLSIQSFIFYVRQQPGSHTFAELLPELLCKQDPPPPRALTRVPSRFGQLVERASFPLNGIFHPEGHLDEQRMPQLLKEVRIHGINFTAMPIFTRGFPPMAPYRETSLLPPQSGQL